MKILNYFIDNLYKNIPIFSFFFYYEYTWNYMAYIRHKIFWAIIYEIGPAIQFVKPL
jgi:hypothetical protein